ncbi:amidase [Tropicimonas sp. S265A]|uniref:amidase n=1 Tax=Tropicimonas sp. S265A TaxID=3415134 RepID=UPI003C7BD7B2
MTDDTDQTAAALGRGIEVGNIDPVDLTEAFLSKIHDCPHRDQIYARTTPERARAEARAARDRARLGLRRSPLDGVPVSWKDLFDTAGVATEAGTALLAGRTPDTDAAVLQNASGAGLVCLGKTHMSELAFSGIGLNPVTATPPNRHDANWVPGGSSSGAAASVAFDLAAAGIGSDTGGSVRIPSAWNDLVGLKTTHGLLSLSGAVPLASAFDTVGPLCRSVADAALLLGALSGTKAPDLRGAQLAGARLAVLDTVAFDDIRDTPRAAFDEAVAKLAKAGAHVSHIDAPEVAEAMALSGVLFATEAYGTWAEVIEAAPEKMFPPILERFRSGQAFSAPAYVAAWRALDRARKQWAARVAGVDAVLTPTAPILPPDRARLLTDEAYYTTENLLALRNTRIGNLMGLCGISLPTGTPACGLQVLAPAFAEARLLRLGAAMEKVLS